MPEQNNAAAEAAAPRRSRAAAEAPEAPKTIRCTIMRDYWDEHGERQPAGTVIDVPTMEAIAGIESGALARA